MSRFGSRGLPLLRGVVLFGAAGLWAVACGGPQPLGAAGSVCFRADECQAGLACVPQSEGAAKHVCSADLSGIVSMVDGAAPEAGDMPDGMGGTPAQAGAPATGGAQSNPGTAGKPGAGGAPGAAGSPAAGGAPSGGSSAGGAPSGAASSAGAPAAGAPAGGSSAAGSASDGAENGGASAGTGG